MITDADRRKLHSALSEALGTEPSELLMELLPPTGWANLATQQDIAVTRADIGIVRSEIDIVRSEIEIAKSELRVEIQDLSTRVDSLLLKLISANIASMIGLVGLVLAALSLG